MSPRVHLAALFLTLWVGPAWCQTPDTSGTASSGAAAEPSHLEQTTDYKLLADGADAVYGARDGLMATYTWREGLNAAKIWLQATPMRQGAALATVLEQNLPKLEQAIQVALSRSTSLKSVVDGVNRLVAFGKSSSLVGYLGKGAPVIALGQSCIYVYRATDETDPVERAKLEGQAAVCMVFVGLAIVTLLAPELFVVELVAIAVAAFQIVDECLLNRAIQGAIGSFLERFGGGSEATGLPEVDPSIGAGFR